MDGGYVECGHPLVAERQDQPLLGRASSIKGVKMSTACRPLSGRSIRRADAAARHGGRPNSLAEIDRPLRPDILLRRGDSWRRQDAERRREQDEAGPAAPYVRPSDGDGP